jgi:hypothetical protein
MMILRQSTAVDIGIGPFVDATDGVTAETGLTLSQADFRLKKNNGAWAQVNDATSATHEENGWYEKELDATDTNTVGILLIAVAEAGALPVWQEYQVVEEAVYDALFAAAALGYVANAPVNVAQFGGTNLTAAAGRPEVNVTNVAGTSIATLTGAYPALGIAESGTMQAGSTATTAVLRAGTSFGDDNPIGFTLWITGGTGVGQSRLITDWVSATDTATVAAWQVTPDNTSTYAVFPTAAASGGGGLDAAATRAALGFAAATYDADQAALNAKLDTIDDLLDTEMPALTTAVADLPTNAELAAALAAADDAVLAAIAALNNLSAAQVNAEVVDALATDTYAESGPPAATASLAAKIRWLATLARNEIRQTSATQVVRNDANNADLATANIADDGTTFTRGEFS